MYLKILIIALVVSSTVMLLISCDTADTVNTVDIVNINFDDWAVADFCFDSLPNGISFTTSQDVYITGTEYISAEIANSMEGSIYALVVGNFSDITVKLVNDEWRLVPLDLDPLIFFTANFISIHNEYENPIFPSRRRYLRIVIKSDDFLYGFIPGTYRIVFPQSWIERTYPIDDPELMERGIYWNIETVWTGDIWTEFVVVDGTAP